MTNAFLSSRKDDSKTGESKSLKSQSIPPSAEQRIFMQSSTYRSEKRVTGGLRPKAIAGDGLRWGKIRHRLRMGSMSWNHCGRCSDRDSIGFVSHELDLRLPMTCRNLEKLLELRRSALLPRLPSGCKFRRFQLYGLPLRSMHRG